MTQTLLAAAVMWIAFICIQRFPLTRRARSSWVLRSIVAANIFGIAFWLISLLPLNS